ncbi:hypothetical protein [Thermogemmatispora tikiterensis]|uniref:Uncharacterized protein n=1 Tax=Thermogemmatispora tikiterensis TaxID=1825093 RepID=A0A328VF01_9CHLR|nr:hypothetical protein [Thermogemmatispora tikiterensis]RAQ93856.1 hypothetical protein A4R35_23580 [Thermogemmatispora tikiterensis]
MNAFEASRVPGGTWLLAHRADGLKAAAIARAEPDGPERALLILEDLTTAEVTRLCQLLDLPPLLSWRTASPEETRVFFSQETPPGHGAI